MWEYYREKLLFLFFLFLSNKRKSFVKTIVYKHGCLKQKQSNRKTELNQLKQKTIENSVCFKCVQDTFLLNHAVLFVFFLTRTKSNHKLR